MKILLIAENVFFSKDANGNCVWNIAKELQCAGNEIHILSAAVTPNELRKTCMNGVFCHWYYAPWKYPMEKIRHEILKKPFLSSFRILAKLYSRYCLSRREKETLVKWKELSFWRRSIRKTLYKQNFDKVIICFYPIEPVLAYTTMQKNIVDIPPFWVYQLDAYVDNQGYAVTGRDARVKFVQLTFGKAEGIFTTPLLVKTLQEILPDKSSCIIPLEFPLLVEHPHKDSYDMLLAPDKICGVFAGTLYSDIRRPDFLLKLLNSISLDNIKLYLFVSNPLSSEQVNAWKALAENIQVEFCKAIPFDEMIAVMRQADFLINIGNKASNQLPSKIVDYIATGKPILNIVQIEACPTLQYLSKYELSLSISTWDNFERAAERCRCFLESAVSERVLPFTQIKTWFQELTPEFVTKTILQYIQ